MKSLIIYYSRIDENYMEDGIRKIDKGNTEVIAEMIKDITGGDLFKIEPVNEYPFDYHECCNVAKEELNNNSRPDLKNYINNLNDYDVIYIGGPVWWGHYPMVIFKLLEDLDFTGKIVKSFTTHEGSGLGETKSDIEKLCQGATIKDGLAIRGCKVKEARDKVLEWINK